MKSIALPKGLSLFTCLILLASIHAAGVTKPIGTFSSSGATNSTIYDNPNLQGVLVRTRWKSIEPEPGVFDLSPLLSQVSAAEAHGKPWSLAVNGGGLGSPDWLFDQLDVPYIDYSFRGESGYRLPLFWDSMAQKRLKLLAERLAEEFSDNANLQLIYITQMTTNGIEGHLNGIDMNVMRKAGFTEEKWINASLQVSHTFATAFPDKALAFEVHELDHSATIPTLIMNKLWNHSEYNHRVGVAMWWISGKTHYQTDLIDALTTFPGDIYGQVIGRSDQKSRFEKEDYTSVFSQAKAIGMRYIEPWEFEFKYENRSAKGAWDTAMADFNKWSKAELHRIHFSNPQELRDLFVCSDEWMPLVSAHRGGAVPGYPENCIPTFENTLNYAYSMLEIDLRYSKDGHIVLHHDSTLDRTTTGSGPVKDLTLVELKNLKLKDKEGTVTDYRMPTLGETIEWARGKTILILDRKNEVSVETCVRIIKAYKAQAHVMIMVSKMEDIKAVYDLDPDIMMEVFLGTHERFKEFDQTGVPWDRIIPFISHQPPEDRNLIDMIHAKGSSCMAGSSRYLDRELKTLGQPSPALKAAYRKLLQSGIDIIETDLPIQVSQLIYQNIEAPKNKAKFFR